MGSFRDYIPEGEDTEASTLTGFRDFVPTPQPRKKEVPKEDSEEEKPKKPKKRWA